MIQINGAYTPVRNLLALTDKENLTKAEKRILAEMDFVCALSREGNGKYDGILRQAEAYLTEQYHACGALSRTAAEEAEKILMPAAQEAKSYRFLCVAHAHIDMNWKWGYDETVGTTVDTFRTMLNIMKEYPDFRFSQSQASVYKIVEDNDPQMLEEIKQQVKEKRWEITASNWVETDKNMPNGESLSRHILYTKEYLSRLFEICPDDLEIDFEPDTFGHSANVPEILSNGGVKFYYHCRGQIGENILSRWEAPSGADVILYTEPFWYNETIDERIGSYAVELARLTGSKTLLKVYGVGDHGGGPTRRDVERLIDMNSWPVYPAFQFSFLRDYFKAVEGLKEKLPVVSGEINFFCDGCYTTQTRIKAGNRKSEGLLRESEAYAAMSSVLTGNDAPSALHGEAWRKVLFNQFHDIIPGSGVTETREYASGLYQQVIGAAETTRKSAFRQICERIDTAAYISAPENVCDSIAEGGGPGTGLCGRGIGKERAYVLFNGEAEERAEIAELVLWDYEGDLDYLMVKDNKGNEVPCQILERKVPYWGHEYSRILIEASVPAMGYALYTVSERAEVPVSFHFVNDMRVQYPDEFVLENDILKVRLNPLDGSLASLIYKPTGREIADTARHPGIFRLVQEAGAKGVLGWNRGMTAWMVGRYQQIESAQKNVELRAVCSGPLRWSVSYEAEFASSKMKVVISLDKGSSNLCYSVDCDWREFGREEQVPALNFYFPLNVPESAGSCRAAGDACSPSPAAVCDTEGMGEKYRYDIPFGVIDRTARDMDLPGCSFAAAPFKDETVMLMAKTKYGYRCMDHSMALTLIRSSCDPDPTPEIGRHHIDFAVSVVGGSRSGKDLLFHSGCYNHPLAVTTVARHKGDLPAEACLLELKQGSVAVSAVKNAEDGSGIIIRVYETDGKSCEAAFRLGFCPAKAELVDIDEKNIQGYGRISENEVSFQIGAYQMKTLKIQI